MARWALRLALALLVLVALAWASLRWIIVPQIDFFRPQLETIAARALGANVSAGQLVAEAGGLGFAFVARDIRVRAPGHGATLTVDRARVVFSVGSLLRGQFTQIEIDTPEIRVRRSVEESLRTGDAWFAAPSTRTSLLVSWVLSQPEIVLRDGRIAWAGAAAGGTPLTLTHVDAVFRGGLQHRALRLDATPDSAWGERLTLMAQLKRPLLHYGPNAWRDWDGELYALGPRLALQRLASGFAAAFPWEFQATDGTAAVRAWLDLKRGNPASATVDVALTDARLTFQPDLAPLALQTLQGRAEWSATANGWQIATRGLQFTDGDGVRWPGGDFTFATTHGDRAGHAPTQEFRADHLDLALVAHLAGRLPLPHATQAMLQRLQPAGQIESLDAHWSGELTEPTSWRTQGRVAALQVAAQPRAAGANGEPRPGVPGIEGATLDWDASGQGGQATLAIQNGALEFPGVFDEPRIPLTRLSAQIKWQREGDHFQVNVDPLQLSNADATGTFAARWDSGEGADGKGGAFPGSLDLAGTLTRADGARVYRYLPLAIPAEARDYVHQAIQKGDAHDVAVRVQGPLAQFPFAKPGEQGTFRIGGHVTGAVMAYVPRHLQPAGEPAWPALQNLEGDLLFQGETMHVSNASAQVAGHLGWSFTHIQAAIDNLEKPRVQVAADGGGALAAALGIVRSSPIAALAQHALDDASATGNAQLQLKLDLPIDALPQSKVAGRATLQNNDIRLSHDAVLLQKAEGNVLFSNGGFSIDHAKVQFLGGTAEVTGGTVPSAPQGGAPVQVRAQGTASAAGLRAMSGWGPIVELAAHMSGQAAYDARLSFHGTQADVDVTSDLKGMAFDLPVPFTKSADAAWPLRYQSTLDGRGAGARQRLSLRVADLLALDLEPAAPGSTPALRGMLAIGAPLPESPQMPAQGFMARVKLAEVNVDDWLAALQPPVGAGAAQGSATGSTPTPPATTPVASADLPTAWSLAVGQLHVAGRTLHDVAADGEHAGATWKSRVQARELAGDVAWTEGQNGLPGGVMARLSHLDIPASDDEGKSVNDAGEHIRQLPDLDVQAERFAYKGKKLGRLAVEAVNRAPQGPGGTDRPPDWQLQHLTLDMPDAHFSASGHWAADARAAGEAVDQRHSVIDFMLRIEDAGELLDRFGMKDVIAGAKGTLGGNLDWDGPPIAPRYAGLNGALHLKLGKGQFLKSDPGAARLLSVLSLQAIPRRLILDFRDVFTAGFAFDSVNGDVTLKRGTAATDNLQMKGVGAAVLINGSTNLKDETQQLRALIVPQIDAGGAALLASLINPAVGIGTFIAQLALKAPLAAATTREFAITGTWSDPRVEPVKVSAQPSAGADKQPAAGNQP